MALREVLVLLYFAGNVVDRDDAIYGFGVRNKLLTFAEKETWAKDSFEYWVTKHPENSRVFLDSGAFGAHTRGAVLDLDVYCRYIEHNADKLAAYAALDVIGSWKASDKNLQIMLRRGLHPLPVFHSGEPFNALEAIVDKHKHIALGGMASDNPTRDTLKRYLDRCFSIIGKHWPVKVHGFGIMAQWALERYPFHSVDSSSALVSAGMGRVSQFKNGLLVSVNWREHVAKTLDGRVADKVSNTRSKGGSAHMGRRARNVEAQVAMERYITRLWASRGVVWDV